MTTEMSFLILSKSINQLNTPRCNGILRSFAFVQTFLGSIETRIAIYSDTGSAAVTVTVNQDCMAQALQRAHSISSTELTE
jgi:hypothetical protein